MAMLQSDLDLGLMGSLKARTVVALVVERNASLCPPEEAMIQLKGHIEQPLTAGSFYFVLEDNDFHTFVAQ